MTRRIARTFLGRTQSLRSIRLQGIRHIRRSSADGRPVMVTPNSNKYADPVVLAAVSGLVLPPFHYMAARGDFEGNFSANGLLMQAAGAFSVDQSFNDAAALRTAVELLGECRRPLVVFPESLVGFNGLRVRPLLPGAAYIACAAARARVRRGMPTPVIHPTAIRYFYRDDLDDRLRDHLTRLEQSVGLDAPGDEPRIEARIRRLGEFLLQRLEAGHGLIGSGEPEAERLDRLLDSMFLRLEQGLDLTIDRIPPLARARRIHRSIAARLLEPNLPAAEHRRLDRLSAELDLIPRLARHRFAAVGSPPCGLERCAEAVERLLDDVCSIWTIAAPADVVVRFGPAVPVDGAGAGRAAGYESELTWLLRAAMQAELDSLNSEDRPRGMRQM